MEEKREEGGREEGLGRVREREGEKGWKEGKRKRTSRQE